MIRREKADVLDELPPITRAIVPVEIPNRADYNRAFQELLYEKASGAPGQTLSALNYLRRELGRGKVSAALRLSQDVLEQEEKLVL